MSGACRRASYARAGRLVPPQARGLRAGRVSLAPGGVMDWHSTRGREELLIALHGSVSVEVRDAPQRTRRITLRPPQCLFLPPRTPHRVINRSRADAGYLYVTAPVE